MAQPPKNGGATQRLRLRELPAVPTLPYQYDAEQDAFFQLFGGTGALYENPVRRREEPYSGGLRLRDGAFNCNQRIRAVHGNGDRGVSTPVVGGSRRRWRRR